MKKNLPYLALLFVLSALAIVFWQRSQKRQAMGGIEEAWYQFGVEDTSAVDRIILRDKTPREIELLRTPTGWQLNKRAVRSDAIEVLLETLKRMEMRNFVPGNSEEEILRRMSTYGKEVEVYAKGKKVAHFLVGTDTPDYLGTYMLNEGADLPFAVHIPGFNGYLSLRFITDEVLWYDRQLIEHPFTQWSDFRMKYQEPSLPQVHLTQDESGKWLEWKTFEGDEVNAGTQENVLRTYLQQLQLAKYEGAIVESDKIFSRKDSLLAHPSFWQIQWTLQSGESHWLKAYRIKAAPDAASSDGTPLEYDPDRMHGVYDDGRMVLLQFYGLRNIMGGTEAVSINVE